MGYEQAPATQLVATQCAVCARSLVDAVSVEIGIGPECRKKYGYGFIQTADEAVRHEANRLVHAIALEQHGSAVVERLRRLFELGFVQLVSAIARRVASIRIEMTDADHPHGAGRYAVVSPYSVEAVALLRKVHGRRWDPEHKCSTFPATSRGELCQALVQAYPGAVAMGPKGIFIVGEKSSAGSQATKG